jgi:hypothetical protein
MRIRSIKPAFWEDAKVAALPEGARLFFIGLWNLADDTGTLRWDVAEVAATLYRYDSRTKRERQVAKYMGNLGDSGMVRVLKCGKHAVIPKLGTHQYLPAEARRVKTTAAEHESCSDSGNPKEAQEKLGDPGITQRGGIGMVGDGSPSEKEGDRGGVGGQSPSRRLPDPPPPARPDVDALLERFPKVTVKQGDMLAEIASYERKREADHLSGYLVVAAWIREAPADQDPLEYAIERGRDARREREAGSSKPSPRRRRGGGTEQLGAIVARLVPGQEAQGG